MFDFFFSDSKGAFPILESIGNETGNISGEKAYFYKIKPKDYSQLGIEAFNHDLQSRARELNHLSEEVWLKIYFLDGDYYLNSNIEFPLPDAFDLIPCNNGLELFFSKEEINSDILILDDCCALDSHYIGVVSVMSYPENSDVFPLDSLGEDLVVSFRMKDVRQTRFKLESQLRFNFARLLSRHKDSEGIRKYEETEEYLEAVKFGEESEFDVCSSYIIKDYSRENLKKRIDLLISILNKKGIESKVEGVSFKESREGFASVFPQLIPGARPKFLAGNAPTFSSCLAELLTISKKYVHDKGISFLNPLNHREELFFDIKKQSFPNRNVVVTGDSGKGKSCVVNKVLDYVSDEYVCVVIEKGFSYKKNCIYHGGQLIEGKFNPMVSKDPSFFKNLVLTMVDAKNFNKLERGKLYSAIKEVLEGGVSNFKDFICKLDTLYGDISPYFEEFWDFYDPKAMDSKFIYLDVRSLPSSIVKMLLVVLVEYCSVKTREDNRVCLAIDEALEYLRDHYELVEEKVRQIRKDGGLVIISSQSSDDIPVEVWSSSYIKILFPQVIDHKKDLSKFDIARMSELEQRKSTPIKVGDYSDCYVVTSDKKIRFVGRNALSQSELARFHTENERNDPLIKFFNNNSEYFESNKECFDAFISVRGGIDVIN